MDLLPSLHELTALYNHNNQLLIMIGIMIFAFLPLLIIVQRIITIIISKTIKIKGEHFAKIIKKYKVSIYILHSFISIYLIAWSEIFDQAKLLSTFVIHIKNLVLFVYMTVFISALLLEIVNIFVDFYKTKLESQLTSIILHSQIIKTIIIVCTILIVLAHILSVSMTTLFTSLGATAALLTFVFKDTILGLFASIQLTLQDIIRIGDWISISAHNTEGVVEEITITVVKIRNFDETITTIPTGTLFSTSVKNWRGMENKGGRRIKRALIIDIDTIKFCDVAALNQIRQNKLIADSIKSVPQLLQNEGNVTNLTLFRYYLSNYLKEHQGIHKEWFSFMIRELAPTPNGLPVEVYVFAKDTSWENYEKLQAEIFDHIFGILSTFELKAFQNKMQNISNIKKS